MDEKNNTPARPSAPDPSGKPQGKLVREFGIEHLDCLDDASRLIEAQRTFIHYTLILASLEFPPDSVLQLLSLCDEPMAKIEAAEFWRQWGDDKDNPPEQLTWAQAAKIIQDVLVEPDPAEIKAQFDAVMKAMPQGPAAVRAALEPWRPKRDCRPKPRIISGRFAKTLRSSRTAPSQASRSGTTTDT